MAFSAPAPRSPSRDGRPSGPHVGAGIARRKTGVFPNALWVGGRADRGDYRVRRRSLVSQDRATPSLIPTARACARRAQSRPGWGRRRVGAVPAYTWAERQWTLPTWAVRRFGQRGSRRPNRSCDSHDNQNKHKLICLFRRCRLR
jgi:hypothetical protein